ERSDVPPNGYVVDYLTFGGIYREVRLRYVEPTYIKDVFVKTFDVLTDKLRVECDVTLKNAGGSLFVGKLAVMIDQPDGSGLVGSDQAVTLTAQGENVVTVTFDAAALQAPVKLWTPESPERYTISV